MEVTEKAVGQKNNPELEISAASNISLDKSSRILLPYRHGRPSVQAAATGFLKKQQQKNVDRFARGRSL